MASLSATAQPTGRSAPDLHRRLLLSGILFGVGVAAFVDETVLHQLLHEITDAAGSSTTTGSGSLADVVGHERP